MRGADYTGDGTARAEPGGGLGHDRGQLRAIPPTPVSSPARPRARTSSPDLEHELRRNPPVPLRLRASSPHRSDQRWRGGSHRGGAVLPSAELAHGHPRGRPFGLVGRLRRLARWSFAPFLARFADGWAARCSWWAAPSWGAGLLLVTASLHSQQIFGPGSWRGWPPPHSCRPLWGHRRGDVPQQCGRGRGPAAPLKAATMAGTPAGCARPVRLPLPRTGAFVVLAAVLPAGRPHLLCASSPTFPPLPITRLLDAPARDVSGTGAHPSFLPAWVAHLPSSAAYGSNLASLSTAPPSGPEAGSTLRYPVGLPGPRQRHRRAGHRDRPLDPWINRLGPARQMRRAVPGALLFSAALPRSQIALLTLPSTSCCPWRTGHPLAGGVRSGRRCLPGQQLGDAHGGPVGADVHLHRDPGSRRRHRSRRWVRGGQPGVL